MSIALPSGWSASTVGQIAEVIGGLTKNAKRERLTNKLPYLRVANVYANRLDLSEVLTIGVEDSELERVSLRPGDMLVVEGNGSPDQIGRVALWKGEIPKAVHQNHIIKVRFRDCVDTTFALWWFIGPQGRAFIQDVASSTSGLFTLSISKIQALPLPIAPIQEQQRIVAALDERLSELDASVTSLERAERNLVRYRAAVLAAACSGKLVPTEADLARRAGRSYEPADQLLARILAERRKANTKAKYEEPAQPDTSKLPKLPEGWVWANGAQVFTWSSGEGLTQKEIQAGPYPVYGGNGVTGFHKAFVAESATLVIGRVGALCGNVYLTTGSAWITDNAIYASTVPTSLCMPFVRIVFSKAGLNQRAAGSGQPFVNQRMLNETLIPLPPLAEQERIVAEVDRHLSRADALAASIAQSKRRAQRLRRAILAAAFQGRLVPQDPNDEPASVLLDRIRAQAATAEAATAATPRRGRPSAQPVAPVASASPPAMTPKRRGRPPGSKNKAKA